MHPRSAARILIVDAERNARNALSELLHDEGYDVSTAIDGAAAKTRIAEFHPDLVLSDVQIDGTAVVLMSARPRSSAAGSPCIDKPIDIEKLLATVQTTLARRG
jgi:DNA-binding response OmpR family regulator